MCIQLSKFDKNNCLFIIFYPSRKQGENNLKHGSKEDPYKGKCMSLE